jgi:hypothetical protein
MGLHILADVSLPSPVLSYSSNTLNLVSFGGKVPVLVSYSRGGVSSQRSPTSSVNDVGEHRVLEYHAGEHAPWSAKVNLAGKTVTRCFSDLYSHVSILLERRRNGELEWVGGTLTVLWSITYHVVSSLVVLELAVIAPPPLLAIVHSPNQAAASPKM